MLVPTFLCARVAQLFTPKDYLLKIKEEKNSETIQHVTFIVAMGCNCVSVTLRPLTVQLSISQMTLVNKHQQSGTERGTEGS
jgi:hypothetical protein